MKNVDYWKLLFLLFALGNVYFLMADNLQYQRKITGHVTDSKGEYLIGVSILEVSTVNGTITDNNGSYTIVLTKEKSKLKFHYLGYKEKVVDIADNEDIVNIILDDNVELLDELVVVGYGIQKKVNLSGAITTVKFDEELENRPITNATQALSGKVPGLWVSQNSGKPGDDGSQLRLRGWGTLNDANPLVIIDGVEGAFNQINPNDIESITVLKDGTSSAIYGSKAANGVILITTKMGQRNEKKQVSLSSYFGIQTLGRRYNLINNSATVMEMVNQAEINANRSNIYPDYLIDAFRQGTDKYKYPNTDWFDVFYENAIIQEHNLSIKGGTEKSSSFLSFNYLDQKGMIPNTRSNRFGIRTNNEYDVNDWLVVGGSLNYIRKTITEPYDISRVYQMLRGAAPFIAPYTRDGRFGAPETINDQGILLYENNNPLIDAANGEAKTTDDFLTANAFLDLKFTKNINLKTTFSTNGRWSTIDNYNVEVFGYTDSGMETVTKNFNREGIEMVRNQETAMRNNLYSTLNYNQTFYEKHELSSIIGLQMDDYSLKNVRARRTDPPKIGLTQVDAGTDGVQGGGNIVGVRMFSYFGRLNYAFNSKYLFEANFRADASSRFKKENRWGYFPGFSVGWRVNEETFIKDLGLFSNFKLRASWGKLGDQKVTGYWPYLYIIGQGYNLSYNYGGKFASGAAVTSFVDENISWETATTTNIGVDLGFFHGKMNMQADFFTKNTSGILVQLPMPKILGEMTAPYENLGKMMNKGIELSLSYGNYITNKNQLNYNLGVNFSYIENEVTKFRKDAPDQLYLIREGYSYQTLYGYKAIGIYQSDEEAKKHMHANSPSPKAGDIKYQDVNNDGKLDFEDKQGIGNTIPKINYGITAKLYYKGFDLNILFQGIAGAYLFTQNQYTTLTLDRQTTTKKWLNAWTPENTNTNIPRLLLNSDWNQSQSSFWMHKSDFLKLRNIQFGYTISKKITSKFNLEKVYLFGNVQNVYTMMMHKGYEGFDPERASTGDGGSVYPVPRIFSVGVNINF